MKKLRTLLTGVLVASGSLIASGELVEPKPFNASILPDLAIYDRSEKIEGLTLSIWGENPQTSLALGIVNGTSEESAGFSWVFLLNYADDYTGVQWAPVNYVTGDFLGWQAAFVNYTGGAMKGLQTGWVNCAVLSTPAAGPAGFQLKPLTQLPSAAPATRFVH